MDYKRKTNSTKEKILYPCLNTFIKYVLFAYYIALTIFLFGYGFFYIFCYIRYIYYNSKITNKEIEEIIHSKGINFVNDEYILNMQISILLFICVLFILGNLLYFQKYKRYYCIYFHRLFLIAVMIYFCYHTQLYLNKLKEYIQVLQRQIVNESITKVISNFMKLSDFQKKALNDTILLIIVTLFYFILLIINKDSEKNNKNKNKKDLSKKFIEMEEV